MTSDKETSQLLAAELSCSSCGGIFAPPRNRLLLKGLRCPYCAQEQSLLQLTGLTDLEMQPGSTEQGPPVFTLGKGAEPWFIDNDFVFGTLFALALAVIVVGMLLSAPVSGSYVKDILVNVCVLVGALLYLLAFAFMALPARVVQAIFVRRPRLVVDDDCLRLKTRSGRLRLALNQIQLVTSIPAHKLDKATRDILFGGIVEGRLAESPIIPYCPVVHLDNGMALVLPLLLSEEQAAAMVGRLNRHLASSPDAAETARGAGSATEELPAPSLHLRMRPAYTTGRLHLPPEPVAPMVFCPHCGAKAELPQQIQMGDTVTCSYCDGLVALRRLDDAVLLKRIRLAASARFIRQGPSLRLRQARLAFRSLPAASSRGSFAIWSIFAICCGLVPVAMALKWPPYVWIPVLATHLFPMLYLMRSTMVRGERKDGFLLGSKILAGLGSSGLWLLPILLYRMLGRLNPYFLDVDGVRLQEGFRFGRKRELKMGEIKRSMVFQWDRLEVVEDPKTYVDRVREIKMPAREKVCLMSIYDDENLELRAIWGLAVELHDGHVYLSQFLGDRSTAELLSLHINRPLSPSLCPASSRA